MEPLTNNKLTTSKLFILTGLILLAIGMLFGLTGSLQYLAPNFLKQYLSFEKVRPLHVSSVVFWIIFAAISSVLTYLKQYTGKNIFSPLLLKVQFAIFIISVLAILMSYCLGIFGGREYWEFHPLLALPIVIGWILFIFNFIKSVGSLNNLPVYVWMWLTGLFFFSSLLWNHICGYSHISGTTS